MNKQGRTYFTANSKAGRKIAAASSPLRTFDTHKQASEVAAWNAAVEEKKKQRIRNRLAKKGITA